jgi:hypothetical protein
MLLEYGQKTAVVGTRHLDRLWLVEWLHIPGTSQKLR